MSDLLPKQKSKIYPMMALPSCIAVISEARKLGKKIPKAALASLGRKDAQGSVKSGSFMTKISSLKQFGLVDYEGNDVNITNLAEAILYPESDLEKLDATRTAFLNPTAFFDLYSSLSKETTISESLIEVQAVRKLGITTVGVKAFIRSFIKSGLEAELLTYDKDAAAITLHDVPSDPAADISPEPNSKQENFSENTLESSLPAIDLPLVTGTQQKFEYRKYTDTLSIGSFIMMFPEPSSLTEDDKEFIRKRITDLVDYNFGRGGRVD